MALTTNICRDFKVDVMKALHNLTASTGHTIKAALYTSTATFSGLTGEVYTVTNEVAAGDSDYTAGGVTLTKITPVLDTATGIADFSDSVITIGGTGTAFTVTGGMMIYNDTHASDQAISIHAFTGSPSASGIGATFTIQFPAATAAAAIIRIA